MACAWQQQLICAADGSREERLQDCLLLIECMELVVAKVGLAVATVVISVVILLGDDALVRWARKEEEKGDGCMSL